MDNQYSYNPDTKLFRCDICGKTYPYEMVHPKEVQVGGGYEPIYACDACARIILLSVCMSKMCYMSKEDRETYFPFLRKKENNDA